MSFISVKTQFAGIDTHIRLAQLFEYIGEKYMQDWKLIDDSGYTTHRDRAQALEVFEVIDDAIKALTEAMDTIHIPENLNGNEEAFLSTIEDRIRTFLPGTEIRRIVIDEEE
jgi:hypothetical protein